MSDWFVKLQECRAPRMRIFFFHYAGGGASIFRGWEKHFGPDVDVFAVQSPGRENRYSAAPIACLETKVAQLRREIRPYLDVPAIFVGHSMGAMLAYELARTLQDDPACRLAHVVLSAMRAPHLPRVKPLMAGMSHDEFIAEIKMYSHTPHEILDDRGIMEVFMPMLRADFTLSESRDFNPEPRLGVPATLFGGMDDDAVPFRDSRAWNTLLDGEPDYVDFDGGHFFIHSHNAQFVSALQAIVRRAMQAAQADASLHPLAARMAA